MEEDDIVEKARDKISEFITLMAIQGIGDKSDELGFNKSQKEKFKSNYWGYIFSRIKRVSNNTLSVIMGLVINNDGSIDLHYNPKMVISMSNKDLLYVIEHEGMHLLNKHISRMMRILNLEANKQKKQMKMGLFGVASDCVVNEQGKLPESLTVNGEAYDLCFPENYNLPPKKLTEFYYNELLRRELEKEKNNETKSSSSESDKNDVRNDEDRSRDKKRGSLQDDGSSGENSNPGGDKKDLEEFQSDETIDGSDNSKKEKTERLGQETNDGNLTESDQSELSKEVQLDDPPNLPDNNIDSHKGWGANNNSPNKELLPKKIEDYTRNIISESTKMFESKKGIGNLPGHMIDMINDILKPPTVPYYQVIKQLVQGSRISKFKNSSTKINRKRSYVFFDEDGEFQLPSISPFPGKKRDFTFDIVILIDTSGSMSIKELMEGLSGIKNLIENDRHCKVTVIENDTKIHKEYEVKRISDIDFSIKGRGGTILKPGILRAAELKCDVCLVFTDGYIDDINDISRVSLPKKIIWAVPEEGSISAFNKTGFIVRTIKDKKDW